MRPADASAAAPMFSPSTGGHASSRNASIRAALLACASRKRCVASRGCSAAKSCTAAKGSAAANVSPAAKGSAATQGIAEGNGHAATKGGGASKRSATSKTGSVRKTISAIRASGRATAVSTVTPMVGVSSMTCKYSRGAVTTLTVEVEKPTTPQDRCDWPGELNITSSTLPPAPQGQARLTHDSELPLLQIRLSPFCGAAVANLEPATHQT